MIERAKTKMIQFDSFSELLIEGDSVCTLPNGDKYMVKVAHVNKVNTKKYVVEIRVSHLDTNSRGMRYCSGTGSSPFDAVHDAIAKFEGSA